MTPTIFLYILDCLDDFTTILFTHYFTIDYQPRRLKTYGFLNRLLLLRFARTAAFNGGPSPPMLRIGPPP